MELELYRGINVIDPETVISDIRNHGFYKHFGWAIRQNDIRHKINEYYLKDDLSTSLTRMKELNEDVVCACGDSTGASYYARVHNRQNDGHPIVVKFNENIKNVFIDGKDFLYPVFQFGDENSTSRLVDAYGESIAKYFDKAIRSDDQDYRVAMCDLACQDKEVIRSHYNNGFVLKGKSNTTFKSAFFIRLPISEKSIIGVEQEPQFIEPRIDIDFRDLINI